MTQPVATISIKEARRLALSQQALHKAAPFGKGKSAVANTIAHLGYVQIDTISVVERAHDHVLWTRVPNYSQKHLLDLQLKDREVLEFWSHAAAYVPMKDYRYMIPTMEFFKNHHDPWPKADHRSMRHVLERIRNEGPLKSRDFEKATKSKSTGWWEWRPAKLALQRLFFSGDLMVSHREGFQRVYDIPERVLPGDLDTTVPTTAEYARYLVLSTIRAHGLASLPEMYYLRRGMGQAVREALADLIEANEIVQVRIRKGQSAYYSTQEILNTPVRIANSVKLLSPFDNAVIKRERLADIFGYAYQIECYVPKPKRKFGYYCLPILFGDRFVGRMDVKAERKDGVLRLIHVFLEDARLPDSFMKKFGEACAMLARFNGCASITVETVSPKTYRTVLAQNIPECV